MDIRRIRDSGVTASHVGGTERDRLLGAFRIPAAEQAGKSFFIPLLPGFQRPGVNDVQKEVEYGWHESRSRFSRPNQRVLD